MPAPLLWDTPGITYDTPGLTWDGPAPQTIMPITSDNRISANLTAQDITDITTALTTIRTKLPFLLSISNQERQELPKLGDRSAGFHDKCMGYMASNPEYLPGFVASAEVTKDNVLRGQMMQFWPNLQTLCEVVDDTLLILGSELMMADLAYYQSVREAAKRGRPGADTIYNDLRQRFPGSNGQPVPPPPGP